MSTFNEDNTIEQKFREGYKSSWEILRVKKLQSIARFFVLWHFVVCDILLM